MNGEGGNYWLGDRHRRGRPARVRLESLTYCARGTKFRHPLIGTRGICPAMLTLTSPTRVDSRMTLTHFAQVASRGRWKPARHLTAIEGAIEDTLDGRTAP